MWPTCAACASASKGRVSPGFLLTTTDEVIRAAHAGSLWYLTFGLACFAAAARYDLDRFA